MTTLTITSWIINGVALANGHFSGWNTSCTPEINDARVVPLKGGKREFDTGLYQLDRTIRDKVSYSTGFITPEN